MISVKSVNCSRYIEKTDFLTSTALGFSNSETFEIVTSLNLLQFTLDPEAVAQSVDGWLKGF